MANRVSFFASFHSALVALAAGSLLTACSRPMPRARSLPASEPPVTVRVVAPRSDGQSGYATWYGSALAGRKTASGERFDPRQMTAAHRQLPFGTWVEVEKVDTGEIVRVRITDRGPFGHANRIIDLSRAAAEKLRMLKTGLAKVRLRVVEGP